MRNLQTKIIILLLILLPIDFYLIFRVAPQERIMGDVQRIFYIHVSVAVATYIGFGVLFIGSVLYLIKRDLYWDSLASSAGEVGLLFATIVMVTGSLWARPVWNVWWTWDPRLVSMLILWFIYAGYFILRGAIPERSRKARYAAVMGIIGFLDIPIVRLATKWWRSIHPRLDSPGGGLDPLMVKVMVFSIITFSFLSICLILLRFRLATVEERVYHLLIEREERDG